MQLATSGCVVEKEKKKKGDVEIMQKFMSGKQFIQDVQATKASPSNFCTQRSRQ